MVNQFREKEGTLRKGLKRKKRQNRRDKRRRTRDDQMKKKNKKLHLTKKLKRCRKR